MILLKDFLKFLEDNNVPKDAEIYIYLKDENGYRPFTEIDLNYYGQTCNGYMNELNLDINTNKEFKSPHFPNNLEKEVVEDLLDKKTMLLEELDELNEELGEYK